MTAAAASLAAWRVVMAPYSITATMSPAPTDRRR